MIGVGMRDEDMSYSLHAQSHVCKSGLATLAAVYHEVLSVSREYLTCRPVPLCWIGAAATYNMQFKRFHFI